MRRVWLTRCLIVIAGLLVGCSSDEGPGAEPADTSGTDTGDAGDTGDTGDTTGPEDVSEPDVPVGPPPTTLDFAVDAVGPFGIGYRSWEHTYTPEGVGSARTIMVHAWYPAEAGVTGDHPTWVGIFSDDQAVIDAPAADPVGEAYPVHVYSHGHQAFAGSSWQITRYLATHGWVVVAPDHVGDMLGNNPTSETVGHYLERPQDVSQSLDALEGLASDDPLARGDTSKV
ncbi:MAG: putative dienelactone hydrolase, partial [Myxococcota bacterium]